MYRVFKMADNVLRKSRLALDSEELPVSFLTMADLD